MKIVGRKKEKRILEGILQSKRPEFLAVYGRRRVGKTFLIREFFNDHFAFSFSGTAKGGMEAQLAYFNIAMKKYGAPPCEAKNWIEAFELLEQLLERTKAREGGRRIVFIDELPWLDTPRSGFLSALDHFWNTWGAKQRDFLLVICGSASSWIIRKVLRDKGGLHGRVTRRMRLMPFTLAECAEFFLENGIDYDLRAIADSAMVFGGIPYYLNMFARGASVPQNVDALCFGENAPLREEFDELYTSLFKHSDKHRRVVRALASKRKGLARDEIIRHTGIPSGGGLTDLLEELEESGFIRSYVDFSGREGLYLYQLVDAFSLFYLTFMDRRKRADAHFWSNFRGGGAHGAWLGYSFELLCLLHEGQIKERLGILGVSTEVSSWRGEGGKHQIDLVIDRADGVIDLCEMKYTQEPYALDKAYAEKLAARREAFIAQTKTRKAVHQVMVAAAGLKQNAYSHAVQFEVRLEDLFR
ncbi:MAG: ATP-binding protein [Clostridiales Family XIII bacterium]|jgi:predicted AAA+ superfamily ATPase|nr:ATP-binding protein [Clostridiales Family XIII bacterium]